MGSDKIKHADNPRYSQDEEGQWWYQPFGFRDSGKPWPRIRGFVKQCSVCQCAFLWQARTQHYRSENKGYFCSVLCANKSPNKYQGAPRGPKHKSWRGGRSKTTGGYILIWKPDHPSCANTSKKYVAEHRLIMEAVLGRMLQKNEHVHHKNGIRDDNRPENLELWTTPHQPYGQRVNEQQHCSSCTCFKSERCRL